MPDDRGLQLEEQLRSGGLGQVLGGAEVQLGRELHAHGWLVPDVWLHEVGGKTYLEWRFRDDKGNTVTKVPSGSEARGVLDAFIKLRDADPSHILNFAKKSGVLGLCNKHQKPFTHNHRLDVAEPRGYIEQPCLPGRESIARWRELAGEAFRAVCMTAELLSAPPLSHVSVSARLEELARRSRGWNQVIGCAQRWLYESAICW